MTRNPSGCPGDTLYASGTEQSYTSPGHPTQVYPSSMSCVSVIVSESGKRIKFTIEEDFTLEDSYECDYDHFEVCAPFSFFDCEVFIIRYKFVISNYSLCVEFAKNVF